MGDKNNNTTTTIADQLNFLRSILHSDDHLQTLPSGDYQQLQIKLDYDIQISCFFDLLNLLNKPLTINHLNDLRIIKSSNKCPLDIDECQSLNLVQGLYYFDQSLQQWTEYSHISLTSDDPVISSTSETWLPERCHFVTWNILFDYYQSPLIHSQQRYQAVLDTLKSTLPDIICLQEVTKNFLNLLLNELWFQQNNYYIIITKNIINSNEEKSYGQLMIMKNFRPRSFSICPLDLSEDDNVKSAKLVTKIITTKPKIIKELIIARFGLSAKVTIDLVNLHLHSDLARNATEKRCQT
ncbi:unnamed protein product, partial [Adineta steineri]